MAKIIINLPGGLQVEREVSEAPKPSAPRVPAFAADPQPVEQPQKTILEKAAEVVEEVVKPKRRGRPRKKPAAE